MKIGDIIGIKKADLQQREVKKREASEVINSTNPSASENIKAQERSSDQVSLTTKRLTEYAKAKATSLPEVREEKVAEIRERIKSGTYQVSNRAIAQAMVGTLLSEIA